MYKNAFTKRTDKDIELIRKNKSKTNMRQVFQTFTRAMPLKTIDEKQAGLKNIAKETHDDILILFGKDDDK